MRPEFGLYVILEPVQFGKHWAKPLNIEQEETDKPTLRRIAPKTNEMGDVCCRKPLTTDIFIHTPPRHAA